MVASLGFCDSQYSALPVEAALAYGLSGETNTLSSGALKTRRWYILGWTM